MSLLPSESAQYSAIIDDILAEADLATISAKQIRKGLKERLGEEKGAELGGKKDAIQALIMERFDKAQASSSAAALPPSSAPSTPPVKPQTNGHAPNSASSSPEKKVKQEPIKKEPKVKSETPASSPDSDSELDDVSPPKKKRKVNKEDADAKLAAKLQAQENRSARATRGGGKERKVKVKKEKRTPKKKSEKKIKADDDSEVELGSDGEVKEKVKKGGFHKLYYLSAPLAELVGESALSRPQVVKKIWEYIKERDLQVPEDKRQIRCDEKMQAVFKQDKVHMFTMNKILGKQLYDVEE